MTRSLVGAAGFTGAGASSGRWLAQAALLLMLGILAACAPRVQTIAPPTQGVLIPPAVAQQPERPARPAVDQFGRQINPDAVRVGLLLPLTGDAAGIGQQMLNAAELALHNTGDANFELIPQDTGGTPEGARRAAEYVIGQGAELILGPLFSASARPVAQAAQPAGVNVLAFTTDETVAGGNLYVMGILPEAQVERIVQYAAAQGRRNLGVLVPDTAYGNLVVAAAGRAASRQGATLVGTQIYPAQGRNFTNEVQALAASNPDAILLADGGDRLRLVAPQIAVAGMRSAQILGTGLWDGAPEVSAEPDLHGAWYAAPSPDRRATFEQQYASRFGGAPERLTTVAYDAVSLATALSRASEGGFGQQRLTDPGGFIGLDGIFRFRPNARVERGLAVLEVTPDGARVRDPAPGSFAGAVF